jgi:four helix bundle protein
MPSLPHVMRFQDLVAYQKAQQLSKQIFQLTRNFPKDEAFSLTSQIRRSSRSVGAQIAEAWGKRRYVSHFVSKLTDADSEQFETQHWIGTAVDCEYWNTDTAHALMNPCEEIGRLLAGMIAKADMFCAPDKLLHEPSAEYFVDTEPLPNDGH